MYYDNIKYEKNSGIAVIKIDRESSLNSLSIKTLEELYGLINQINIEEDIKVLIISGEGDKAFSTGADIIEMKDYNWEDALKFSTKYSLLFETIANLKFVTIAAVNGYALGAGNELALACDIRIASETALFGQPEISLGNYPGLWCISKTNKFGWQSQSG